MIIISGTCPLFLFSCARLVDVILSSGSIRYQILEMSHL
jgi:hypothetical protein